MSPLEGQTVLCVGGASGMGYGVAQVASEQGARVIVTSRSEDKAVAAAEQLAGDALGMSVDVTDDESVETLFGGVDRIDHLMITAGAVGRAGIANSPPSSAPDFMKGKLWATHRVLWHSRPKLSPHASIGLITGGYAQWATPDAGHVHMAFAATEALARAVAVSFAPIRCNVIRPGFVDTGLWDFLADEERQDLRRREANATLTGAIVTPRDIGVAAVALMVADAVTGVVIPVDGGRHLTGAP